VAVDFRLPCSGVRGAHRAAVWGARRRLSLSREEEKQGCWAVREGCDADLGCNVS